MYDPKKLSTVTADMHNPMELEQLCLKNNKTVNLVQFHMLQEHLHQPNASMLK